jgi:sodium-coupled neutral amino acid transporter 2
VHPILNELQRPSDAKNVVRVSIVLCTLIYVATSVFCFSLFGEDTLSDVLSNFDVDLGVPHSALVTAIIRVGYAIHLMLVYPLLNFSLRLNLDGLIFPRAVPLSVDTRRFTVLTAAILALTFLGASFIPDIYDAFQLTGSTSAVCIGFVFPAVLVLR